MHDDVIGRLPVDSLPDANLFYVYPMLKQLYDSINVFVVKQSTSEVLQVKMMCIKI